MLLIAVGGGMANPSGQTAALSNVSQEDAGLGSGILTTVAQLGQALGLALIVTLAISSAKSGNSTGDAATVHGYHIAFVAAAAALAVGALLSFTLLGRRAPQAAGEPAGDRSLAEQSA
jgi:MFS family permease